MKKKLLVGLIMCTVVSTMVACGKTEEAIEGNVANNEVTVSDLGSDDVSVEGDYVDTEIPSAEETVDYSIKGEEIISKMRSYFEPLGIEFIDSDAHYENEIFSSRWSDCDELTNVGFQYVNFHYSNKQDIKYAGEISFQSYLFDKSVALGAQKYVEDFVELVVGESVDLTEDFKQIDKFVNEYIIPKELDNDFESELIEYERTIEVNDFKVTIVADSQSWYYSVSIESTY